MTESTNTQAVRRHLEEAWSKGGACAVLYLASDASRRVNGAELALDGGFTAQ